MRTTLRFANTANERSDVRALRREIRDLNLARYGRDADGEHDPRMDGRTLCAYDRGRIIGAMDVHWGGDAAIDPDKLSTLRVDAVAAAAKPDAVVVLDSPLIHPDFITEPVAVELKEGAARFALRKSARWVFSTCHPTDIGVLQALGFRANGSPQRSRTLGDYLPIVLDLADVAGLSKARSPLADAAARTEFAAAPAETTSDELDAKALWRHIYALQQQARANGASFLSDIDGGHIQKLLLGTHVVKVPPGHRLITKGERKRELFLVLRGTLIVRDGDRILAYMGPGDVVGEIGLVLDIERTSDVIGSDEEATVLRLSDAHLQEIAQKDPALAARVNLGIAKALCIKLVRAAGLA